MKHNKIIGFCGYSQVGKDTAFQALHQFETKHKRLAFADSLKADFVKHEEFVKSLGVDTNTPQFKEQMRSLYIDWSRTLKTILNDELVWVKRIDKKVKEINDNGDVVVLTDVRYFYEVAYIIGRGGIVFGITRPGTYPKGEESKSIEEIKFLFPNVFNKNLITNDESKEKFNKKVIDTVCF